ncbi:unnamed protein product [marine sediment metagenome]|uniref:Uncharacterized protein n=1 Tax=marine sediment metagenome TaxID=412755 RepID=X1ICC5_9ZZZZ
MARVVGPFLSIDASGTTYDILTASIWKGRNYMRGFFRPTNPKTAAQFAVRTELANAVASWQGLYSGTQDLWNVAARDVYPPISGFNYYVMQYILQDGVPTIPPQAPRKSKSIHGRNVYGLDIGYD